MNIFSILVVHNRIKKNHRIKCQMKKENRVNYKYSAPSPYSTFSVTSPAKKANC